MMFDDPCLISPYRRKVRDGYNAMAGKISEKMAREGIGSNLVRVVRALEEYYDFAIDQRDETAILNKKLDTDYRQTLLDLQEARLAAKQWEEKYWQLHELHMKLANASTKVTDRVINKLERLVD